MSISSTSSSLLPFSFLSMPVRGRLLRLNNLEQHVPTLAQAPDHLRNSLAELLTVSALLAFDSRKAATSPLSATVQVQHSGAGVLLFAQCRPQEVPSADTTTPQPTIISILKAYANPAAAAAPFSTLAHTPAGPHGGGILAVTLEQTNVFGGADQRIQSLIPVAEASISRCLEAYYNDAVQTPTYLRVVSGLTPAGTFGCGALFLQKLPDTIIKDDDWLRLGILLETLTPAEVLGGTITETTLLQRLFAEDDLTLFTQEELSFQPDNPRPRMLAALAALPPEELRELLETGPVVLTDETSGHQESFTEAELHDFLTVNLS